MGGDKEDFIPSKSVCPTTGEFQHNNLRIHINSGEMHIHDDANKLKAAIPIAKAWKIWEQLSTEVCNKRYIDIVNNTMATFAVTDSAEINISLVPFNAPDTYKKLDKFFKR